MTHNVSIWYVAYFICDRKGIENYRLRKYSLENKESNGIFFYNEEQLVWGFGVLFDLGGLMLLSTKHACISSAAALEREYDQLLPGNYLYFTEMKDCHLEL